MQISPTKYKRLDGMAIALTKNWRVRFIAEYALQAVTAITG
jgi:hypothetical protein